MELQGGYIRSFETETQFNEERNDNYYEPWVSYTQNITRVDYNKTEKERLRDTPLTFEITGDGDIIWHAVNTAFTRTIEYKKNDGEWTSITSTTAGTSFSVASGDTVQFRGNNTMYGSGNSGTYFCGFSGTTAGFNIKGNIMSLINKTNFKNLNSLNQRNVFAKLFAYCTGLTDANKLILPATTLSYYCYGGMFAYCTNLTTAPELPATTLTGNCYGGMFSNCTNLTTAPELPATTLGIWCYSYMFVGCTSLTTAPELPATTLENNCYYGMFSGCTNLNYIKCLATENCSSSNLNNWVAGVQTTSGLFIKDASVTWSRGNSSVPLNWDIQDA